APTGAKDGPAVQLRLSPPSGVPGTVLTVTGELKAPLQKKIGLAQLCWDGCKAGLHYQGVSLAWVNPTQFTASIVVPAAPWLESGTRTVKALATGDYKVSIECITNNKGCGLGSSEGSATFHLKVATGSVTWCPTLSGCARLTASPSASFPGDIVKLAGYAPLISIIGSDTPTQFELKVSRGEPPPDQLTFSPTSNGAPEIIIGHARLLVQSPPPMSAIGKIKPSVVDFSGPSPITENPANPGQIVWCSQGNIGISGVDGNVSISTVGVRQVLTALGYGTLGASSPNCVSVALADGGSLGKIVLASFGVAPSLQAPPLVNIALETSDRGVHWTPVPVPPGSAISGFAGFRYQGSSLQALFAPDFASSGPYYPNPEAPPLVEMLKSGNTSWIPGTLDCPVRGPCMTFGSFIPGNCVMTGSQQSIFYSSDNGANWFPPSWPIQIQACAPNELVPVSGQVELLISSSSQYLIRESIDGGSTWRVLSIPSIPGVVPGSNLYGSGAEIQMLLNGSLIVTGQHGNSFDWELLLPGSGSWCPVKGLPAGVRNSSRSADVHQLGNSLYWVPLSSKPNPRLHSISVADLKC
ncbi:MAG: hypothetical protein HKL84_04960, partial [Acidimicrobiaceae bacterium]|nr:hypothetical protein [Acidimicrobiaceae bacterium]